jgi:hypothetical protein
VIRHGKGDRRRIAPINRHACAAIRVLGRRNRGAVRAAPARTPHTPRATRRAFVFGELGVDRTRGLIALSIEIKLTDVTFNQRFSR